jgi:hypothetical protein
MDILYMKIDIEETKEPGRCIEKEECVSFWWEMAHGASDK